jgi:hypothetical protein
MLILNPLVDIDNPPHNISGIRTTAQGHTFCFVAPEPYQICAPRYATHREMQPRATVTKA